MTAPARPVQPTAPADYRHPLPADVIARGADTDSSHGTPTSSSGGAR